MIHKVSDLIMPELALYHERSEVRLRRLYEPEEGVFICESEKVIRRALEAGYRPLSFLAEERVLPRIGDLLDDAEEDFPVYCTDKETLSRLAGYKLTGGFLACLLRKALPPVEEECGTKRRIVVMYDVENPTNIGAIFRSAAALGMEAAVLTCDSVDPLYRRASRVSMGTVFQLPWTRLPAKKDCLSVLRELGFTTAAFALTDRSVPVDEPSLKTVDRLAVLMGNEGYGLPEEVIRRCDYVVKIPMAPGIDSLNVAAASAVAFWELGR